MQFSPDMRECLLVLILTNIIRVIQEQVGQTVEDFTKHMECDHFPLLPLALPPIFLRAAPPRFLPGAPSDSKEVVEARQWWYVG